MIGNRQETNQSYAAQGSLAKLLPPISGQMIGGARQQPVSQLNPGYTRNLVNRSKQNADVYLASYSQDARSNADSQYLVQNAAAHQNSSLQPGRDRPPLVK